MFSFLGFNKKANKRVELSIYVYFWTHIPKSLKIGIFVLGQSAVLTQHHDWFNQQLIVCTLHSTASVAVKTRALQVSLEEMGSTRALASTSLLVLTAGDSQPEPQSTLCGSAFQVSCSQQAKDITLHMPFKKYLELEADSARVSLAQMPRPCL